MEGKAVRDRLSHRLGAKIHDSWFSAVAFAVSADGVALATARAKFVRDWIASHYADHVLAACREVWPAVSRVEFVFEKPKPATAGGRAP